MARIFDKLDINLDVYDIQSNWIDNVASKYLDIDKSNQLKTGLFGYLNEVMASEVRSSVYHRNFLYDEAFLNTACLSRSIYNKAKTYSYDIPLAIPSTLKIKIKIKKDDIIKFGNRIINTQTETRSGNYKLTIKADENDIVLEKYKFKLETDIDIYARMINKKIKNEITGIDEFTSTYLYSARYVRENDLNGNIIKGLFSNSTSNYIKTYSESIKNVQYLVMEVDVYQYEKTEFVKENFSKEPTDSLFFNIPYNNNLCNFTVYYETPSIETYLNGYFNDTFTPDDKYYYYYNFDNEILNIYFSGIAGTFKPLMNSKLTISAYTTLGKECNFNYSGDVYFKINQNNISSTKIIAEKISNPTQGTNQPTKMELKKLLINEFLTRENLITEYDLQVFFNDIKNKVLNDSELIFIKKRDDVFKRTYVAFALLKDEKGLILPTNTVDLKFKLASDQTKMNLDEVDMFTNSFYINTGSYIYYDDEKKSYLLGNVIGNLNNNFNLEKDKNDNYILNDENNVFYKISDDDYENIFKYVENLNIYHIPIKDNNNENEEIQYLNIINKNEIDCEKLPIDNLVYFKDENTFINDYFNIPDEKQLQAIYFNEQTNNGRLKTTKEILTAKIYTVNPECYSYTGLYKDQTLISKPYLDYVCKTINEYFKLGMIDIQKIYMYTNDNNEMTLVTEDYNFDNQYNPVFNLFNQYQNSTQIILSKKDSDIEPTFDDPYKNIIEGITLQVLDVNTKEVIEEWITEKKIHSIVNKLKLNKIYILHEKGKDSTTDLKFKVASYRPIEITMFTNPEDNITNYDENDEDTKIVYKKPIYKYYDLDENNNTILVDINQQAIPNDYQVIYYIYFNNLVEQSNFFNNIINKCKFPLYDTFDIFKNTLYGYYNGEQVTDIVVNDINIYNKYQKNNDYLIVIYNKTNIELLKSAFNKKLLTPSNNIIKNISVDLKNKDNKTILTIENSTICIIPNTVELIKESSNNLYMSYFRYLVDKEAFFNSINVELYTEDPIRQGLSSLVLSNQSNNIIESLNPDDYNLIYRLPYALYYKTEKFSRILTLKNFINDNLTFKFNYINSNVISEFNFEYLNIKRDSIPHEKIISEETIYSDNNEYIKEKKVVINDGLNLITRIVDYNSYGISESINNYYEKINDINTYFLTLTLDTNFITNYFPETSKQLDSLYKFANDNILCRFLVMNSNNEYVGFFDFDIDEIDNEGKSIKYKYNLVTNNRINGLNQTIDGENITGINQLCLIDCVKSFDGQLINNFLFDENSYGRIAIFVKTQTLYDENNINNYPIDLQYLPLKNNILYQEDYLINNNEKFLKTKWNLAVIFESETYFTLFSVINDLVAPIISYDMKTSDNELNYNMNDYNKNILNNISALTIKGLPVIGNHYIYDYDTFKNFFDTFSFYYNILKDNFKHLETNTSVNLKFYNTYGPSITFKSYNNEEEASNIYTDVKLKLYIKLAEYSYSTELDYKIKKYIVDFLNECNSNDNKLFAISNLLNGLERNFDDIIYVQFDSFNNFINEDLDTSEYQLIKNNYPEIKEMTREQLINYVPEFINIHLNKNAYIYHEDDFDTGIDIKYI